MVFVFQAGRPEAGALAAEAARPPEFEYRVEVGLDPQGRWWQRQSDSLGTRHDLCDQRSKG